MSRPRLFKLPLFAIAVLVLLTACSTEETIITSGTNFPDASDAQLSLRAISTKPWLVTGGDVLIELRISENLSAQTLSLELNDLDVSTQLVRVSSLLQQILLSDLPLGDSVLRAELSGGLTQQLRLTNYPISGPIISGEHETPFFCQASDFITATGAPLGPSADSNCYVSTQVDHVYWSADEEIFKPYVLASDSSPPTDVAQVIDELGESIPFIVRVETGVVNRAIYEIAMLHDPAEPAPTPWVTSAGWNGKLVYTHGGGCRSGWYQQGKSTGGVLREGLLARGYALVSSSLNVFGQNCNDLLASETHIMVKERFIEHYGEPVYTIATGVSGGSYQSHQTADNYPGVFDGIIVGLSFPDVTSATIFTLADARLLHHYFNDVAPDTFSEEEQRLVSGFGVWDSIANLARGAARLDPIFKSSAELEQQGGEVSVTALEALRYDSTSQNGVRATVYDHTANVYGMVPGTRIARRPLDNVGIQYGLAALNDGGITVRQFLDLNRDIGGFDRDLNHVPERHQADIEAARSAIESGRILDGGAGLAATPVIDYRSYMDAREGGDIHMIVHQFSTRQRLMKANGHADNHVMQVGGRWGYTEAEPDLGNLFSEMDRWLMGIKGDFSDSELAVKVQNHKPSTLDDACWQNDDDRRKIDELQTYTGVSDCNNLYPAYSTPRQVAGSPLANDIVACELRPPGRFDYAVQFSEQEFAELREIFSAGVCDWSQGDRSGASHQGVWKSFGPSPINQLY